MKRVFDIVAALTGLAVLSPLLALVAVAVWLEDRQSPWFRAARVGRYGQKFRMLKFRTMIPDAWKSGVFSTAFDDSRITRVGRVLRRVKLDELPQLWNVLAGDMSLVGPRPQVEAEVALYTLEERRMFEVRPGITDLASIVFADEGDILAGSADPDLDYGRKIRPWKSRLALLYLEHTSFVTDLKILVLTILGGITRERALRRIARLLACWNADPLLIRMASRREALQAWPPPGSQNVFGATSADAEIVDRQTGGDRRGGPVDFREDAGRAGKFPHQEVFDT